MQKWIKCLSQITLITEALAFDPLSSVLYQSVLLYIMLSINIQITLYQSILSLATSA